MIDTSCPRCRRKLVYQDQHAGLEGQCDGCGTTFIIPEPTAPIAPVRPYQSAPQQQQQASNSPLDSLASLSNPNPQQDQYQNQYQDPYQQQQQGGYQQGNYGGQYQYQPNYQSRGQGQSHFGMAIAGFILSLIMPLVGLILSAIALSSIKKSANKEGRGLAQAGLIIGIAMILISCVWGIVAFAIGSSMFHK